MKQLMYVPLVVVLLMMSCRINDVQVVQEKTEPLLSEGTLAGLPYTAFSEMADSLTILDVAVGTIYEDQFGQSYFKSIEGAIALWKTDNKKLSVKNAESIVKGEAHNSETGEIEIAQSTLKGNMISYQRLIPGKYLIAVASRDTLSNHLNAFSYTEIYVEEASKTLLYKGFTKESIGDKYERWN